MRSSNTTPVAMPVPGLETVIVNTARSPMSTLLWLLGVVAWTTSCGRVAMVRAEASAPK